ncbi:hypothetical protein SAMN05421766_102165 [Zobellia uliginosa]|uniref:Uncharacterized protein n=1 Tax=Zobellia uliginosa TaxID=143224 RepID=A0ABY1KP72_9FLAO|nr:hypothetical protein [Zobellia uliginosa]SIS47729.1 hypothetical protein SAMN05421766_102165 [Zobellia uliginosa]
MLTKPFILLLGVICLSSEILFAQSLGYNNNRIAISADGNNQADKHPEAQWPRADPDDWGGTPAALAMIAKLGLQDKLVHFSYNNFIAAPPHTSETNYMADGVKGAIKRWNFDPGRFFDVPEDKATAITHLAEALKKSTATDPLYFIHMGPSEFFYRAVKEVVDDGDTEALAHVYVISHSGYNDNHLRRKAHHTMKETIALSGNRIKYKKIKDQNACDNPSKLWCSNTDFSPYYWMRDHSDPDINWLYSRTQFHPQNKGADISDAGMVWYLLLGDEDGNLQKFQKFIGDGITPLPECKATHLIGVKDFEMLQIDPFVTPYKDHSRNAVAIDAVVYKNEFAATQKVFKGITDHYNITLTTLTEEDGESTYRLKIDGKLIGEFQNPETARDMAPYSRTFKNVPVKTGDIIQIESNTHSNGKIPEDDAYAYARGRWRSISFECSPDRSVEEKKGFVVFEAERFELKGAWKLGKDTEKASGGAFIYYDGPNTYQKVDTDHVISYTFKIETPGNYTIKWMMRQPEGERGTDKGNDIWIHLGDNLGYAKELQLKHFEKYYGRSDDNFTLNGVAEIHGAGHGWLTGRFPKAGTYTLHIGGRSHGLQIDRFLLFKGMTIDEAKSVLIE